ncbi:MAG: sugar phosphate isomerase/epimerase family protein [Limisphaerales bacterium]
MTQSTLKKRLAVCSWSLQPNDPQDLVAKIKATTISAAQLALDPLRESPEVWGQTQKLFRANRIAIVSGMFGCVGEDYSTMEQIRRTGGLAPDATWEQNRKNIAAAADIAAALGLRLVTFHAGFLPHDESDPGFKKMLDRVATVADLFEKKRIVLGLETGQETASALATFLQKLQRPNVGVNIDPANMVLYDNGNPVAALRTLGPWLRQVHIKDAVRTKTPGTWGDEVPAGTGDVRWKDFFATLEEVGYRGPLVIEREAGAQRVADVRTARSLLEKELCQTS